VSRVTCMLSTDSHGQMSIRFIAWADGRSRYTSSRGLCVYNIMVRDLTSVHSFIPFNFPVHTHFYTVTVFPFFIAGSYVVSYITAIDFFFKERYAFRCIVGHTISARYLVVTSWPIPFLQLCWRIKYSEIAQRQEIPVALYRGSWHQTHLGTTQDPFSYMTLTANRNLVDFGMSGLCVCVCVCVCLVSCIKGRQCCGYYIP